MKNIQTNNIQKQIQALQLFKEAYVNLLTNWSSGIDLNELESVEQYPFNNSFDEITIDTWCDKSIQELEIIRKNMLTKDKNNHKEGVRNGKIMEKFTETKNIILKKLRIK